MVCEFDDAALGEKKAVADAPMRMMMIDELSEDLQEKMAITKKANVK
jgi:hypothetical protein